MRGQSRPPPLRGEVGEQALGGPRAEGAVGTGEHDGIDAVVTGRTREGVEQGRQVAQTDRIAGRRRREDKGSHPLGVVLIDLHSVSEAPLCRSITRAQPTLNPP